MKQGTTALQAFYWNFIRYLTGPSKSVIFIILFYSLWVVADRLAHANFDLTSFTNRPIGSASFDAFDVGARVSLYYSCVGIFFAMFLGLNLIAYFIHRWVPAAISAMETRAINYTALAGISLYIFVVYNIKIFETLEIIYFLHKFFLFGLLLTLLFRKNVLHVYHHAFVLCLAFALYFLEADLNNLFGYATNPDVYLLSFANACLLLIGLHLALRRGKFGHTSIARLAYVLAPLAFLPFLTILKDEIFLILKANGKTPNGQSLIYGALLLIISLVVFMRTRKKTIFSLKDSLAQSYFPLLIFSFISYTLYAYCTEYYDELFESGNVYLPLMENRLFGLIPTLEKLNTHLISDYFLNALYACLNGLNMHEIVLYEFLIMSFSYLLFYYVVYYVSRNEFVAFFSLFLFPYAEGFAPAGFFMGVLGIFAIPKLCLGAGRFKDYLFFSGILAILILWRIDLAFSCVLALPGTLLYFHLRDRTFSIRWSYVWLSFVSVFGLLLLIVAGLSLYRDTNFFAKIPYFLHYSMSAQSYGLRTLGWSDSPSYKMHYYVYPVLVGLLTVYLIVQYEKRAKRYKLAYLSMIYMCLFYFVSFNRGIIRHSLLESTDSFTSTFLYSIVPGMVYFLFRQQSQTAKFILFIGVGVFMIQNYRLPDPGKLKSPFEQMVEKLKTTKATNLAKLESRVFPPAPNAVADKDDFVAFIKRHTTHHETYIDFSNRPMFHFFTQKETPAWFYQNPLCVRDDYLQDRFVADLSHYKTPFLLFSGLNEQFYESVDQVPNNLRHYRMAEYFYQHYRPYVIVDGLCLWRSLDVKPNNRIDTVYRIHRSEHAQLNPSLLSAKLPFQSNKKYLVKIRFNKRPDHVQVKAFFSNKTLRAQSYIVNDTVAYCLFKTKDVTGKSFVLTCDNTAKQVHALEVMACDNIPDFTCENFSNYTIRKLPYVWGGYDKLLPDEPILFKATKNVHPDGQLPSFTFPENIDKTTGNTVVVYCSNSNNDQRYLNLSIGPKTGHLYTTMGFEALPSKEPRKYAFRVSCNYKWYSEANCRGFLWANNGDMTGIRITRIEITKGK